MDTEDRRLIESLVRSSALPDWSLERLLRYADGGLGVGVTLLVNGVWIEGDLVRVEEWADVLDDSVDQGMAAMAERLQREQGAIEDPAALAEGAFTAGDVEHLREMLRRGGFRSAVDDRRASETAIREAVEALDPTEDLPDDRAGELAEMQEPIETLTLHNVLVRGAIPAGNRFLPYLRVLRVHIAAWHLGHTASYPAS